MSMCTILLHYHLISNNRVNIGEGERQERKHARGEREREREHARGERERERGMLDLAFYVSLCKSGNSVLCFLLAPATM